MVEQFFIVNKSGGMIFKHEREDKDNADINSHLILTSSLYSINLISSKVTNKLMGNQVIYFRKRVITIFKAVTGTMFIFVAEKPVDVLFEKVYGHYCDYVTKNPFYCMEMPINCTKFQPQLLFDD